MFQRSIAISTRLANLIQNLLFERRVNNDSEASCYGRAINLSSTSVRRIGQIFVGLISSGLSVPMLLANVDWVDKKTSTST
jgi:hypothetical protein